MNKPASVLLRGLQTTAELTHNREFTADQVNELAASLGLSDDAVLAAIDILQAEREIDLQWGGKVVLAAGKPSMTQAGSVTIGPGGVYAPNAGSGAAIASSGTAAAAGATVVNNHGLIAADLAAALQALRAPAVPAEVGDSPSVRELADAVRAAILDAQAAPQPASEAVQRHIERLRNAIAQVGEVALKVHAVWFLVEKARELLALLG
jgi:hypothetical protein